MYHLSDWNICDDGITVDSLLENGNRLFTGNGFLGRRGVPDDANADCMPATIISGLYDRHGDQWREPVNAPDPLYTTVSTDAPLRLDDARLVSHEQALNFRYGIYSRKTVWRIESGALLTLCTERFADMRDVHRLCAKHTVSTDKPCRVTVTTGINCNIRDLNGPHLGNFQHTESGTIQSVLCNTLEQGIPLAVASANSHNLPHTFEIDAAHPVEFAVYGAVYFGAGAATAAVHDSIADALKMGWDAVQKAHKERWDAIWDVGDVLIEGDDYAQRALRYSLYHLHCIAPRHGAALSVPARGLSGQTYKGAIFWDTEMFIAPYFLATEPELVAEFIRYRIGTLSGAKRKAAEYGYRGAFYAWESQETGDDACTDFNVVDVFTGRPVRTYFRDKQVHISADIVYAIKRYVDTTGDTAILREGALEVVLECARFFLSYMYYSPEKRRYEVLDVIGPDEYHERVHNNAFTNRMIFQTFEAARDYVTLFRSTSAAGDRAFIDALMEKLDFAADFDFMETVLAQFYIPLPKKDGGEQDVQDIIEQFDGYFRLEDCTLDDVRSRLKDPKEYWGGGGGVATATRIIKQADVVTMLVLFGADYPRAVKKANLAFYEPLTEHGSSLSSCMYALLSCDVDDSNRAYPYFIKSAEIDITGKSKHFAGLVYIGGTHPAANGGAWMVAIQGFCGFTIEAGEIKVKPRLPEKWQSVAFSVVHKGLVRRVKVTKTGYEIT